MRVYFGRCSRKGLFLCNGKSPAGGLLGELLVQVVVLLLKGGGIEAVAEDGIDTVVLGCLGLAQYGEEVEKECGVKVIDPAFVALGCAELAARLALKPSRRSVAAYRRNQK